MDGVCVLIAERVDNIANFFIRKVRADILITKFIARQALFGAILLSIGCHYPVPVSCVNQQWRSYEKSRYPFL